MVCELFKHLNPKELVVCSMVNKRWHSIYSGFKLYSLVVFSDFAFYPTNSGRPIKEHEHCQLNVFDSLADKQLLSNLKHLALGGDPHPGRTPAFNLNKVNQFRQLTLLEVDIGNLVAKKINLNLPKLNVLKFIQVNYHCSLFINCPDLRVLLYRGESKYKSLLKVKHPETIRKLETDMLGKKLERFKNVECLVTQELEAVSMETANKLPRLTKLCYNENLEFAFKWKCEKKICKFLDFLERIKQNLKELSGSLEGQRGADFQIFFSGFPLNKIGEIDFIHRLRTGPGLVYNEYIYLKNHHLIDPDCTLSSIRRLNYSQSTMMKRFDSETQSRFLKIFTQVKAVEAVWQVLNANHFLWYLKSLRSLKALELRGVKLSQEFYNQLPSSAPSLIKFSLIEQAEKGLELNFDFIGNFSYLFEIWISNLSFESFISLLKALNKSAKGFVSFQLKEKTASVSKEAGSKLWRLQYVGQTIFEDEDPGEMVTFIERAREKRRERLESKKSE